MDPSDRQAIPEDAVLRQPENGRGIGHQPQAGASPDAIDGFGRIYPRPHLSGRHRAPDLSVFAAECGHCAAKPSVVQRHHVCAHAARLDVLDGGHGLVQPLRAFVAIVEHARRPVLSGGLGGSVDAGTPEVFNTDQGVQYTAGAFTDRLELAGVAISMDGRGRWMDNVFVERLWRTVKYEYIYLHDHATPRALEAGLAGYFPFYNDERLHAALDYSRRGLCTRRREAAPTESSQWSKSTSSFSENLENFHVPITGVALRPRETFGMGFAGR